MGKYLNWYPELNSSNLVVQPPLLLLTAKGRLLKIRITKQGMSIDQFLDTEYKHMSTTIQTELIELDRANYCSDYDWPAAGYQQTSKVIPVFSPPPQYEFWIPTGQSHKYLQERANAVILHNRNQFRLSLRSLDKRLGATKPHAI